MVFGAELSEEEAADEYEAVVIPIYEELVVDCLGKIMNDPDASQPDLARTYGELMVRHIPLAAVVPLGLT